MEKTVINKSLILLLSSFLILQIFTINACSQSNNTYYVDINGNADFTNIQNAIEYAKDGDTIIVRKGTYHETLFIDKNLTIKGQDKPTILGNKSINYTIIIYSTNIQFEGFIITHETDLYTIGFYISRNNSHISNCEIKNIEKGFVIYKSEKNNIEKNIIKNTRIFGIELFSANNNTLQNNQFINNSESAIHIFNSKYNDIKNNDIEGSKDGLIFRLATNNNIFQNNITNNTDHGIYILKESNNNILYQNNFINNSINAIDENKNQWYNNTLKEGNYWDDYTDKYPNATKIQNIWNTSYEIETENNKDIYPLINKSFIKKQSETIENQTQNNTKNNNKKNNEFLIIYIIIIIIIIILFLKFLFKFKKR